MDQLSGLAPEHQAIAGIVFVAALALFAAWARVFGKREGAAPPRVQEFYAAGGLHDMGPVKELIEQMGLLCQQQVRTNLALEACAEATTRVAKAYEEHLEAEATQEEIETRAQQLFERRLAEERPQARRRRGPAKKPAP